MALVIGVMQGYRAAGGSKDWQTAQEWAYRASIKGDNRHGNGAVKGSWSGTTAPGLALASTMQALMRRGEIEGRYSTRERLVWEYRLKP